MARAMGAGSDIVTSIKHPAVAAARRSVTRSGSTPARCFLVDGRKMVAQALDAGATVEGVFFLDPPREAARMLLDRARRAGVDCHIVSRGVFFKVLHLGYETAADVLAVVRREESHRLPESPPADFCTVVGECIHDPRNVGVIVRTADAAGLSSAVFSADSADPFSRAAVRSTTGSIFRVPLTLAADLPAALAALRAAGVRIIGTSATAETPCWEADLGTPCALVLGNETVGLSADAADVCDTMVTIPMSGGAHSFNVTVAAGILLYEWARQRAFTT